MASLTSWLLFVFLAPLVLLAPGYLVLRILRTREASIGLSEGRFETVGFSAALSLAIVVLVGYALSQTVGLTRGWLALTYVLLLGGLGLVVHGREARAPGAGQDTASEERSPSTRGPVGGPFGVPSRHLPVILIGVTLAIVATGALIYDGSEPYTQAYYANASEVEPSLAVEAGEHVNWTLVVENHEQRTANYTLQTVRIPQANASEDEPPGVPVDEANLALAPGEDGEHTVHLEAPEGGLWKVQTRVHVDGKQDPLTVHRWIAVSTS